MKLKDIALDLYSILCTRIDRYTSVTVIYNIYNSQRQLIDACQQSHTFCKYVNYIRLLGRSALCLV